MAIRRTGVEALKGELAGDPAVAALLDQGLRETGEEIRVTHGFHAYPAGLHPDTAKRYIEAFPGQRLLDPFCGGGTTLVEARLQGRTAIGRDLSPVGLRVARTRTATPPIETIQRFRSTSRKLTEAARTAQDLPDDERLAALQDWYAPHTLRELESIRRGIIDAEPHVQDLLWATLSSIVVKTSWRSSDTSMKREQHRRPPGTAAILFHKKARELGRRLEALCAAVPEGTPAADILEGDARHIEVDPVHLIVTSPPYPSTYDYLPLQHLRHVWLPDARARYDDEIGSRRDWKRRGSKHAVKQWLDDTRAWMGECHRVLEPDGHLLIVIGDGLAPSGTIDTARPTQQVARDLGMSPVAMASVERPDHARESVRWEHAFVFRKKS